MVVYRCFPDLGSLQVMEVWPKRTDTWRILSKRDCWQHRWRNACVGVQCFHKFHFGNICGMGCIFPLLFIFNIPSLVGNTLIFYDFLLSFNIFKMHWQHTNLANFDFLWIISYFSTTHPVLANLSTDQVKINVAEAMKGAIHLPEKGSYFGDRCLLWKKQRSNENVRKKKKKSRELQSLLSGNVLISNHHHSCTEMWIIKKYIKILFNLYSL